MTSCTLRSTLTAVLFATAASLSACSNDKTHTAGCASDQECINSHNGDSRWYCDATQNPPACSEAARECNTADDCCPSQVCNLQGHFCADKFTSCTGAGSCPVAGEICATIGVRPMGLGCTFAKCSAAGTCADSSTVCFNDYCVGAPPCNGGCSPLDGEDRVCVTATNYCSPSPKEASCQRTCPTGQLLVLHDPNNIFDTCTLSTETCDCISLPPLVVHDVARHSGLATAGTSLYISAYDGEYGDLVVHTYDKSNLATPTQSTWVDGVPSSGTLGGDPNGPRHGITNPGPNVGQYSSIAASSTGDLYVAYYDVDNGDLKFTARYGGVNATWTTPFTLDGSSTATPPGRTGDVGLYTSIALTSGNFPAIAYFQRGSFSGSTEAGNTTKLLYIVALKAQPAIRADWSSPIAVETLDKPAAPCNGGCTATQVCVGDINATGGSRCATPAASCTPACTGQTTCVAPAGTGSSICATSLSAQLQTDLPQGTGLMPSLKFKDDLPVIAYYDSIHHDLKAVTGANVASGTTVSMPGFGQPVVIDGADVSPAISRDTGRYPSVAIGPPGSQGGRIAITFQDLTSQQLLLYQADTLISHAFHDGATITGTQTHNIHLIDDGKPAANATWHPQTFPGVQSSVAFTPSGAVAIAYQDGTLVDMNFIEWDPTRNAVESAPVILRGSDGKTAAGFYSRIVVDSAGTAYMSSATIRASTAQQSANKLNIDSHPAN